jgi:hypothetical protein
LGSVQLGSVQLGSVQLGSVQLKHTEQLPTNKGKVLGTKGLKKITTLS